MKRFLLPMMVGIVASFALVVFVTGFVCFVFWENFFTVNIGDLHPLIRLLIAVCVVMGFTCSLVFHNEENK